MPTDPAETVALFRYRVIAEAANHRRRPAERGLLVRAAEVPDQDCRDAAGVARRAEALFRQLLGDHLVLVALRGEHHDPLDHPGIAAQILAAMEHRLHDQR